MEAPTEQGTSKIPKSPVKKCTVACDRCKYKRIRCIEGRGRACAGCAGKYECRYNTKNKKRGPKGKSPYGQLELASQEGAYTFIDYSRRPRLRINTSLPLKSTLLSPISTVDSQLNTPSWPINSSTNLLLPFPENECYSANMLVSTTLQDPTVNRYYYPEESEIRTLNMVDSEQNANLPAPNSNFYNGIVSNNVLPTYQNQAILSTAFDTNYTNGVNFSEISCTNPLSSQNTNSSNSSIRYLIEIGISELITRRFSKNDYELFENIEYFFKFYSMQNPINFVLLLNDVFKEEPVYFTHYTYLLLYSMATIGSMYYLGSLFAFSDETVKLRGEALRLYVDSRLREGTSDAIKFEISKKLITFIVNNSQ